MLTRPGDFWTFKVLDTALSSSMEKGSMLKLRTSALWILGSSCSSEVVRVAPRIFLQWSVHFVFLRQALFYTNRWFALAFSKVFDSIPCRDMPVGCIFGWHSVDFALDIFCFSIGIGFVKLSLCLADLPKRGLWRFILMLFSGGDDSLSCFLNQGVGTQALPLPFEQS